MISIYNEILDEIKPSDERRSEVIAFSDEIKDILTTYAKSVGVDIKCYLVGSVAKRTSLKNKADIDIFMAFDTSYSDDELKNYGLDFGRHCINKLNGSSEIRYASHPYITGFINGFEIDFVPCYDIEDASNIISAVDRTIHHTKYIKSHITDKEADEVLLLKKFMRSVNTYGANFKVSGFSGYLCELLIAHYHSFDAVIDAAANMWSYGFEIDLEDYGTCCNFKDPFVVIDPVDKNRNVATALTLQKYSEFIMAARNYQSNPCREFFTDRSVNTTKDEISDIFTSRGTKCYIISVDVPDLPDDVIYPQIDKTTKSFKRVSEMYDFNVIKTGYYMKDNTVFMIIEYEVDTLSNIKVHNGPKLSDKTNCENFKNKYPSAYIRGDKLINLSERKYKMVEDMINSILRKENISILKLGKNIKKEILKDYKLHNVFEFIETAEDEDLRNLYLYLNENYNIER